MTPGSKPAVGKQLGLASDSESTINSDASATPWQDASSARRNLISGSLWATATSLLAAILGPALTVITVRWMTVSGYGSLAVAVAATTLLGALAGFGLGEAVSRAAAGQVANDNRSGLGAVKWASSRVSWICTAGGAACVGAVSTAMVLTPSMRADVVPFVILAPIVLTSPWNQVGQGLIQATFRPRAAFAGSTVTNMSALLLTAIVFALGLRSADLVAAARTVAIIGGVWIILRGAQWWSLHGEPSDCNVTPSSVARLGSAVLISTALAFCISQLDVFLLGAFKGSVAAGRYAPASRLADFVITAFALPGSYLLPALSAAIMRKDDTDVVRLYHWTSKWAIVLCTPALGIMIASPAALMHTLFGSSAVVSEPARILAIGVLGNTVCGFNGLLLTAYGETRVLIMTSIVALCVNVLACAILIPMMGTTGAALATAIPLVAVNAAMSLALARRRQIYPWDRSLRWTICALIVGLSGAVGASKIHLGGMTALIIAASAAGMPPLAAAIMTSSAEDRQFTMEFFHRFRHPSASPKNGTAHAPAEQPANLSERGT